MNILAIETSSEACSCALHIDATNASATTHAARFERFELAPRQHTQLVLPMVESLLAEAGVTLGAVDYLAFGRGPGSFTGVRIAASAIQGLALAIDRPVVAVSTLAALAMADTVSGDNVLAVFDARMGEVYLGAFTIDEHGLPRARCDELLGAPGAVPLPAEGEWIGVGGGWVVHGEALASRLGARLRSTHAQRLPAAAQVARLGAAMALAGQAVAAEAALPEYLRRDVATPRRT